MDPVTKNDFQKFTQKIAKIIDTKSKESKLKLSKTIKQQFKFYSEQLTDKVEYQLKEAVKELKSENLNFKDEIITEIKNIRLETEVNSSHRKILTDHETRLTKVEKHVFSN